MNDIPKRLKFPNSLESIETLRGEKVTNIRLLLILYIYVVYKYVRLYRFL